MIPITPQAEPADFNNNVRNPGTAFLAIKPNPTKDEWKGHEYWQRALSDMRTLYKGICAYSACWIPYSTGCHSVDHFLPKGNNPSQAYEWSNFRYASSRFNSRKGVRTIVDPFQMNFNWFTLDFITLLIKPNKQRLSAIELSLAINTIEYFQLNDDDELVEERYQYYDDYINGLITFEYLQRQAPFIASELRRQGLMI